MKTEANWETEDKSPARGLHELRPLAEATRASRELSRRIEA